MQSFPLTLEQCQDVSNFCQNVLNLDDGIHYVGVINKNGRILESTHCNDGVNNKLNSKELEMLFMQCSLLTSMMKDFDYKLGLSQYALYERETISEFVFPCHLGMILILVNPQKNPKRLARKITKLVHALDLWVGAKKLR